MERDGFYIDSPYFAKKRAEIVAINVKETIEKFFLNPGKPDQLESLRDLISRYVQCPVECVTITKVENGFDVSISPEFPTESLSMEVTFET